MKFAPSFSSFSTSKAAMYVVHPLLVESVSSSPMCSVFLVICGSLSSKIRIDTGT